MFHHLLSIPKGPLHSSRTLRICSSPSVTQPYSKYLFHLQKPEELIHKNTYFQKHLMNLRRGV